MISDASPTIDSPCSMDNYGSESERESHCQRESRGAGEQNGLRQIMHRVRPNFWIQSNLSLLLLLLLAGGCATTKSTVRVESKTHPQADFAAYKTFAFKGSSEPHDSVYFSSANQARIRAAITAELKARGLQPASSPDLTITVYLRIAEKQHDKSAPAFDDGTMTYNL